MRTLSVIVFAFFGFTLNAHSGCRVFVPEQEFIHAGYPIHFDFGNLLASKGYEEVYAAEGADFLLRLSGAEVETARFHEAHGVLELGPDRVETRVICFTQWCGISDFAKAFSKSYQKLKKQIPHCQ
jgi:hypothetical protein